MSDEIADILKGYLLIEDEPEAHVLRDILDLCKSERGIAEAIARLESNIEDYSSGLEFLDEVPLYYLFLAYAQYKWGRLPDSVKSVSNAINGFEQQAQVRNHALGLWIRASLYRESEHNDAARQDIMDGIELIERELADSKRTSHYQECKDCETIHSRMLEFRNSLGWTFQKQAPKPVASHSATMHSSFHQRPGSYVTFPVYTVRAGPEGEIAYESAPLGDVIIETVIIAGKVYQIHSLRERPEVVLRPAIYRWLQVQGDSMENAQPVPILEGDCVLSIDIPGGDYNPRYGDIVIAARRTIAGSEGAALIKRFTPDGLCSESHTTYPTIPLRYVSIRGLAIAIAKPVE